jgi:DNA transformation protein and related proteins
MGQKGDKKTTESGQAARMLVEMLAPISGITLKSMFGGYGIFHEGNMCCLVNSLGECFMKVGDSNRADFEARGSRQHGKMPYFLIPEDILNHQESLIEWAEKSIAIPKK